MFGRPKRQVPTPIVHQPHQSENPMFAEPEHWSAFRTNVLMYTGLALLIVATGWLMYGNVFRIQTVTVTGTRVINPVSVKRVTERYLTGTHLLFLPNGTLWTLSSTDLTKKLEADIRQRISVERVVVEKVVPRSLNIIITERTPVVTWKSTIGMSSVDRQGKVIELRSTPVENTPLVTDESNSYFTVDSSVVKPEVIGAIGKLDVLLKQANIQIDTFFIPVPECPAVVAPATNTNSAPSDTNVSTINANTNTSPTNVNSAPVVITPPCDQAALRYSSQEIHAQLKNGPRILFDRQSNLSQSVKVLQRVLAERTGTTYKSIDVRFGDRVYVK